MANSASDDAKLVEFLNTASRQKLIDQPYIGVATADKIIRARPIKALDDLAKAGVSPRMISEIGTIKIPGEATGGTGRPAVTSPKSPPPKATPKHAGFADAEPIDAFDKPFLSILQERGDDRFEGRVPPLAFLGIYYGPPANKTDVFVIWVVETPLEAVGKFSRFAADFRQILSTKHEDGVDLKRDQHFIENYVDEETISTLLRAGKSDPDSDSETKATSELLFAAIKTGRFVKLIPQTANAKTVAVAALIDALAARG